MALTNLETNSRFMMLSDPQWAIFRYNLWISSVNHTSINDKSGKQGKHMDYIKTLRIKGYKKFTDFTINFTPGLSILIGENTAGKSTILEAIEIVLNQSIFKRDFSQLESMLNKTMVTKFLESTTHSVEELPKIEIEVVLSLDNIPQNGIFWGQHYSDFNQNKPRQLFGIKFRFEFDENFIDEFKKIDFSDDSQNAIPLEYYHSVWRTFGDNSYVSRMNPLRSLLIDNSKYFYDLYGSYAKRIFGLQVDTVQQRKVSYSFKQSMIHALHDNSTALSLNRPNQEFTINQRKAQLADLLDISENQIPLQNMGQGKESLVKTELSLDSNASLVMIEEPENHLSYSNTRKMISEIQKQSDKAQQVIVTTHESMVLNRLNLNRAIWIREEKGESLASLSESDAAFFMRNDDFDILKFILARKVILVEGASEYITLPSMINKITGKSIDELGISILSLHGIHYEHFLCLAKHLNKPVLVLTDNDGKKTDAINEENRRTGDNISIKTPDDNEIFTFEVALERKNVNICKNFQKEKHPKAKSTSYKSHNELSVGLACALAHKTDFAMYVADEFDKNDSNIICPDYIREGVEWLRKLN